MAPMIEIALQNALNEGLANKDSSKLWALLALAPTPLDATVNRSSLALWIDGSAASWERLCESTLPPEERSQEALAKACAFRKIWRAPGALAAVLRSADKSILAGDSTRRALLDHLGPALLDAPFSEAPALAALSAAESEFLGEAVLAELWSRTLSLTEGVGKVSSIRPGWLVALPAAGALAMAKTSESSPERAWGSIVAKAMLVKMDGGRPMSWSREGAFECLTVSDWGEESRLRSEWACGGFRDFSAREPRMARLLERFCPRLLSDLEPWLLGANAPRGADRPSRPRKA